MPVETNASIRVYVPSHKAEIEIECLPHNSFWHLKLCLVDGLLSSTKQQQQQLLSIDDSGDGRASSHTSDAPSTATRHAHERITRPQLMRRLIAASRLKGRKQQQQQRANLNSCCHTPCDMPSSNDAMQFSIASSASSIINGHQQRHAITRCYSSAGSLSSAETTRSSGSGFGLSSSMTQSNSCSSSSNGSCSRNAFVRSQSQHRVPAIKSSSAFYYGFSGLSLSDFESDNARQSSDIAEDEDVAYARNTLISTAAADLNCFYAECDHHNQSDGSSTKRSSCVNRFHKCADVDVTGNDTCHCCCSTTDMLGLANDEQNDEFNVYESVHYAATTAATAAPVVVVPQLPATDKEAVMTKPNVDGATNKTTSSNYYCDDQIDDELNDDKSTSERSATSQRLFEQALQSGYINFGFYSFSLAKFVDDQTSLTDYLTTISSSTGTSYYLDLEFKQKQRQQAASLTSLIGGGGAGGVGCNNDNIQYTFHINKSQFVVSQKRISKIFNNNKQYIHPDATSLIYNSTNNNNKTLSNLSLNSLKNQIKRSNSISLSTNGSYYTSCSNITNNQSTTSFTNNMIAKLASNGGGGTNSNKFLSPLSSSSSSGHHHQSASQSKRKRSKLLDLLLNTNWSKLSQQANNLMKLNKALLVCDANFLDEKTGESPLSLAISSIQINTPATISTRSSSISANGCGHLATLSIVGCPQSASLFNLQSQQSSASHSRITLQQTSAVDICQLKSPLVERILLLLIKSGALIDFRNNDGRTPLHIAAMKSNFWALKTLLDLGASTDYRDINGLTPLYYSILHKAELKVCQLLLNYISNKDPSAINLNNTTTTSDDTIDRGIGITDQNGWQEVHHACKLGLDAHLDKLLYYGCDINAKISGSGNTPLHVAAINDQLQAAKVLLLRGADRTITNNSHQTAHQVAVISNNMDLAEFIASHDQSRIVPFVERPNFNNARHSMNVSSSISSQNNSVNNSCLKRFSLSPGQQQQTVKSPNINITTNDQLSTINSSITSEELHAQSIQASTLTGMIEHQQQQQQQQLNPLTLDVKNHHQCSDSSASITTSAPTTGSSCVSNHTNRSSLLSFDATCNARNQRHAPGSNISPCLSQRSCATSNTTTTSSSGVCCDADGNQSDEPQKKNVTIISIGNDIHGAMDGSGSNRNSSSSFAMKNQIVSASTTIVQPPNPNQQPVPTKIEANVIAAAAASAQDCNVVASDEVNDDNEQEEEDLSSSESSSNGLHSLMSERRPMYAGSIVEATSDYQSGDPNHLQLRRGDLIEVLEYPSELVRDGQLPRMANKPMLFGRRQSDGRQGLFPSFCVRRSKLKQSSLRQRIPMTDLTNNNNNLSVARQQQQQQQQHHQHQQQMQITAPCMKENHDVNHAHQSRQATIRGPNLPGSQSMAAIIKQDASPTTYQPEQLQQNQTIVFREFNVALTKVNEGFGFVLRGARINPATLPKQQQGDEIYPTNVIIDERLMTANNLASLQYLDDIEQGSVAQQAGLKRGDFLVAVNNQDVRLCSHEQVVQMIRRSGDRVNLTIATPVVVQKNFSPSISMTTTTTTRNAQVAYSSKTLTRIKPEPPKRDPTTTLTRNKANKIKSQLAVAPQFLRQQHNHFDASKPLPQAPLIYGISPTSNAIINRSISSNLPHFNSANSLSSITQDSHSISSVSTVGSFDHQRGYNQRDSITSSSTTQSSHQLQQTPDHSSSSTTTMTTVATTKPNVSTKSDGVQLKTVAMNNLLNQTQTYQPAAVITSNRRQPESIEQKSMLTSSLPPPPSMPPPPPPPPLPDLSSPTINNSRLVQRRTSAPVAKGSISVADLSSHTLKKRDSIATVVGVLENNTNNGPTAAAAMCTVAAACAAAANNRLQRQQQKQENAERKENKSEIKQKSNEVCDSQPTGLDTTTQLHDSNLEENMPNEQQTTPKASHQPNKLVARERIDSGKETNDASLPLPPPPPPPPPPPSQPPASIPTRLVVSPTDRRRETGPRVIQSATLGRKSSAQIIQQPKSVPTQIASQTLKSGARSKRLSILDYDMLPPPPPPLPPQESSPPFVEQQRNVQMSYKKEQCLCEHHRSNHTNSYHRHPNHTQSYNYCPNHVHTHQRHYELMNDVVAQNTLERADNAYGIRHAYDLDHSLQLASNHQNQFIIRQQQHNQQQQHHHHHHHHNHHHNHQQQMHQLQQQQQQQQQLLQERIRAQQQMLSIAGAKQTGHHWDPRRQRHDPRIGFIDSLQAAVRGPVGRTD